MKIFKIFFKKKFHFTLMMNHISKPQRKKFLHTDTITQPQFNLKISIDAYIKVICPCYIQNFSVHCI